MHHLNKNNINLIFRKRDTNGHFTISADKDKLSESCDYFSNLFSSTNEHLDNIEIYVPDICISYNIVAELLNYPTIDLDYPKWKYILLSYQCHNFFGLDFDINKLDNLIVEPEEYSDMIHTIKKFNVDEKIVEIIVKNLPKNYDKSIFSDELLIKILFEMHNMKLIDCSTIPNDLLNELLIICLQTVLFNESGINSMMKKYLLISLYFSNGHN